MKKLIFLLFPFLMLAQNPTNFPYGIKNTVAPSNSTPSYFVTQEVDGVHKKTPAALIAFKSDLPVSYAVIVYVNATNPNSATIFDDENPPTTNDNAFKADVDNLYIGTDASTWVYNGSTYVTKSVPASSNFKIVGTGVDAGSNKTSSIYREGSIGSDAFVSSNAGMFTNRNGSNTAQNGGFYAFSNAAASNIMMFQLNASNGLDLWNYASSTWSRKFTFTGGGNLGIGETVPSDLLVVSKTVGANTGQIRFGGSNGRTLSAYNNGSLGNFDFTANLSYFSGNLGVGPQKYISMYNYAGTLPNYYQQIIDASDNVSFRINGTNAYVISPNRNVLINTTTDNGVDKLQVNGSTKTTALTLTTNPTTSASTYDFLTRNTSNGVVEKVLSNTIATVTNPSGTANYLSKFLTATTIGLSSLWDTGTFLGIGTANTPTKDITLGNQGDREIGIEESNNTVVGRNLILKAGRTVNYVSNVNFNKINPSVGFSSYGMAASPTGNVYACNLNKVFKQTGGTGSFVDMSLTARSYQALAVSPANNVYVAVDNGDIYKQTNETGSFTALGQTSRLWSGLTAAPNGDVYASVSNGDIYKQTNGTGNFVALGQTSRLWGRMTAAPNGDVFCIGDGNIYKQTGGTGNFVLYQNGNYTGLVISVNNNFYAGSGSNIFMQTNCSGSFNSLGQSVVAVWGMACLPNGNVYSGDYGSNIYMQQNNGTGSSNLDGGTLKNIAGTGKGTGKSRYEIWTGQKLASGTDMQIETLREYVDENGYHIYVSIPIYANDAAADADVNLPSGASYKLTGNRTIFHKP